MVNIHRVRVVGNYGSGGPGLNTFYYLPVSDDAAGALICADRVRAAFFLRAGSHTTAQNWQVSGEVDSIDASTGNLTNTWSVVQPATVTGTAPVTTQLLPPASVINLALLTSTFIAGRRVRGRAYLSGIASAAAATDGSVLPATRTGWDAVGAKLMENTAGTYLQVWHRPSAAGAGVACPVTSTTTRAKFAVLRCRRD